MFPVKPQNFLLLIIALLLVSTRSTGQDRKIVEDFRTALNSKDFMKLQERVGASGSARWSSLRDLAGDFMEGVLLVDYHERDTANRETGRIYNFRTNVIIKRLRIIYYEIAEEVYIKGNTSSSSWFRPIGHFKDDNEYNGLKNTFYSTFHASLNDSDLFITNFKYGDLCGYGKNPPEGRQQVDAFIANRDKASLIKWLQSGNLEKQVYAVDGFSYLKRLGVRITEEEMAMIKYVLSKQGTMYTCVGCVGGPEQISEVIKRLAHFDFSNTPVQTENAHGPAKQGMLLMKK